MGDSDFPSKRRNVSKPWFSLRSMAACLWDWRTVFFLSTLLGSGLELVIGWFLDLFWNLRYWDYSGYFLNFRGYICLVSALGFGIAGVLWVCIFSKILQKWWYHISLDFRKKWNMFWVFIFVIDCAAALIFPNTGYGITF